MMKLAISIWENRLAPVFDVSRRFLIIDIECNQELNRYETTIPETSLIGKAGSIIELKVEVLICGAISRLYEEMLLASGIQVVPRICGQVEEVLQAFITGKLDEKRFLMPGCCGRRRRFQGKHGQNRI
ncbi:NifB/NifX family molybdenum-iron cluster-binding protein [bacterium]|nr:NifB/NifX family molybdenum-iron cluster-binding protein [bacterium]